ncbi:MAG: c-type cytochrome [Candidatus Udaeobacter sp.]
MRFYLGPLVLFLGVFGNLAFATPESPSDASVCKQVDLFVAAAHAAYQSPKALVAYKKLVAEITKTIEQRRLSGDQEFFSQCQQFVDYMEAASLDLKPDHKLGFNVTDKQYFEETQRYVQVPPFLCKQQFLGWASRSETLPRAKAFLKSLNSTRAPSDQLIFFSYRSRHLGTPDNHNSYRRLLVVVPGDASQRIPEKWVQFGVTDPGKSVRVRNVSVVSALPNSDGTFNAYFKDYFRTYRSDAPIQIKGRWEMNQGSDNCAKCHKNGVLPIFPADGSVIASERQSLRDANNRLLTYGTPRFDKYLDERKFGPGLADATPSDRTQRFGEAFDHTATADAMSCARCHNDQDLGALNWPMSRTVVKSFVKGGHMPPGYSLSERDRDELYQKLIDEYFATDAANPGILKCWLLGIQKPSLTSSSMP